jgi:hypothetical protein
MNKRAIKNHFNRKTDTYYVPVHYEKYVGKPPIICRSSWESAFCRWADYSHSIVRWASEDVLIKYQDPHQPIRNGKPYWRSYYPDYTIETDKGEIYLIEVKPEKQTKPPRKSAKKSQKTMLTEQKTWKTNQAKFRAAQRYCERRGWVFKIITEKELFGK